MKKIEQTVGEILSRPYSRVLIPQEEGGFSAEILEFAGCFAEGETADEAYSNLEEAARGWVEAVISKGETVPVPITNYEASGKFALRLPRGLYARAAKVAAKEGVSLNQFVVDAVAERTGEVSTVHRLDALLTSRMAVSYVHASRFERQSVSTERQRFSVPAAISISSFATNENAMGRN